MQRNYLNLGLVIVIGVVGVGTALPSCLPTETTCDDGIGCVSGEAGSSATSGASGKSGAGGGAQGGTAGGNSGGDTGGTPGAGGGGMSGGGAGEGGGGGAVSLPCDGACIAPKAVCDEPTDECVECLKEEECTSAAKKKCDPTAKTCVECLAPADCTNAAAAKCDGGSCAKCTTNDDCVHIAAKGVCDTKAGECVECTVGDETACGGKSCNPTTKACTNTTTGSIGNCKACLADSECSGGNQADPDVRCIPMEFQGTLRAGGFCLRRAAKTCGRPYTIAISNKSLSGAPAEKYCGIDQANVRCEAVVDLEDSRTCAGQPDTACGCARDKDGNCTEPGTGGLCRDFAVLQDQCTYQCGVSNDCPTGKLCQGAPTKYCQ